MQSFHDGVLWRAASFLMLGWLAVFFGRTLAPGQTPLIERIARVSDPAMTPPLAPVHAPAHGGLVRLLRDRRTDLGFPRRCHPGDGCVGFAGQRNRSLWANTGCARASSRARPFRACCSKFVIPGVSGGRPSGRPIDAVMLPLTDTPLLAAAAHLDSPAVIGDGRDWTWRDVHAASVVLAQRLEDASTVCNLCSSRVGFLVTWLAALRRGCLQLLPPSGGHADLIAILKSAADPVIVVDDARLLQPHWAEHARCMVHSPQAQPSAAIRCLAGVEPGPGRAIAAPVHIGQYRRARAADQDPGPVRPGSAGACGAPRRRKWRADWRQCAASFAACRRSTCSGSKHPSCCRWLRPFRWLTGGRCCPRMCMPPSSIVRMAQPGSRRPCTCARSPSPAWRCPTAASCWCPPCRLLRRWPRR